MARVLVTGGAGFIGSHLVDKLHLNKHTVAIVDDLSGGNVENFSNRETLFAEDCRDFHKIDKAIESFKPEIVYHLAANAAENKAQFSPIDITSRNYSAFINTLTSFINHGGKRFVFTSSIAVYGAGQVPFKETDKPEPEDLYGITKLACEQSLKVMAKVHGFEYVIARPHNVYGPRQNMSDPYRNVVTIWMNALMKGAPHYIYGDGSMKRCFSYIDDVVDAIYNCGFKKVSGMTFNIGADTSFTLKELSDVITDKLPVFLPAREQEVEEAVADHTLAKKFLGYKDRTALLYGIRKTWDWCRSQGPQEMKHTGFEIDSPKIPLNWQTRL